MSERDLKIKYQELARERRTAVNSHFLAYSAGVLGFQTSIIISKDVPQIQWPWLFAVGSFAAIASIVLGSIVVLARLRKVHSNARVYRFQEKNEPPKEIEKLKNSVIFLGRWINRLVPLQVITFAIAALRFIAWLVTVSCHKF